MSLGRDVDEIFFITSYTASCSALLISPICRLSLKSTAGGILVRICVTE